MPLRKIIGCLFLALMAAGCAREPVQPQLLKSMTDFDRAYVPTLVFSDLHKQRETEIAMDRLKSEWNEFNTKYYGLEMKYGVDITDKFWKEDFKHISSLLLSAEAMVQKEWLKEANDRLEKIRPVFKAIRNRHGLGYFLDDLNDFHDTTEGILVYVQGKSKLRDRDIIELKARVKQAGESLSRAENARVGYDFDAKKVKAIKQRIKEEQRLLTALADAVTVADRDRILEAAQALRPNFVVLYKAFGDFQPIFDQIVKERENAQKKEQKQ